MYFGLLKLWKSVTASAPTAPPAATQIKFLESIGKLLEIHEYVIRWPMKQEDKYATTTSNDSHGATHNYMQLPNISSDQISGQFYYKHQLVTSLKVLVPFNGSS